MRWYSLAPLLACILLADVAHAAAFSPLTREGYELSELSAAPQRRDWQKEARTALAACTTLPAVPAPAPGRLRVVPLVKDRFFNKFFQGGGKLYRLVAQQKGVPHAVILDDGIWTLPQLSAALADTEGALKREGSNYLLRLPLLVSHGAAVVVKEGEALRLSRDRGVFVISMGGLYLRKARLEAWDEEKKATAQAAGDDNAFQPFLLGWSGSESVFSDSGILGLGFNENLAHGLSFAVGPQGLKDYDLPPPARVVMSGNRLEGLYSGVHVTATPDARICHNTFVQSRLNAVHLDEGSSGVIADNTITETQGAYALYLAKYAHDVWILRNDVSENHRSALSISDGTRIVIAGNQIRQNYDAVFLQTTEDVLMADNLIVDNQRHGVSLRGVGMLRMQDDHIGPNRGVGVIVQQGSAARKAGEGAPQAVAAAPVADTHRRPTAHRIEMLGVMLEGNHSSAMVVDPPYSVVMDQATVMYPGVRRRPVFRGVLNSFESDILTLLTRKRTLQVIPVASRR